MPKFIKMKETRNGADDGYTVKEYKAGEIYPMGDDLAAAFIRDKVGEEVSPPKAGAKKEEAEPEGQTEEKKGLFKGKK